MKYRVLLKFLLILVYVKRFFWWIGSGLKWVLRFLLGGIAKGVLFLKLKAVFALKRAGLTDSWEWMLKRDFLQILIFLFLFLTVLSHTSLVTRKDLSYSGQKTLAYTLIGGEEEASLEVITAPSSASLPGVNTWKNGVLSVDEGGTTHIVSGAEDLQFSMGGTAINKPILMPGAPEQKRNEVTTYEVAAGDSLSSIAYEFGVSVSTIMWENGLNSRSIIRPGDALKIPPTTGVMHTVKKGDTINKIATLYDAKADDIVNFNRLSADGHDLIAGERIMVPNGEKSAPSQVAVRPTTRAVTAASTAGVRAAPPNSTAAPSASGFVWPSRSHTMTQYYGLYHHAIDVGGPWQTPIYATKSGVVEVSQCGWNNGYGCYIIINHGGGIKSLYGHNSQLLVSAGDQVTTGQTVALMGNTGNVRGATGIHLHFEFQVNGAKVNPLKYVH